MANGLIVYGFRDSVHFEPCTETLTTSGRSGLAQWSPAIRTDTIARQKIQGFGANTPPYEHTRGLYR